MNFYSDGGKPAESDPARGPPRIPHDGKTSVVWNGAKIAFAAHANDTPHAGGRRRTPTGRNIIANLAGKTSRRLTP